MGILDSLLGRNSNNDDRNNYQNQPPLQQNQAPARPQSADEQAVARYRYMLQTAPPEDVERAHTEAFERLSPEQRQMVLQQLSQNLPASEQSALRDDPQSLGRAATRAEMRQPGTMERVLGGGGGGMGGGMMGGGMGMMGGMIAGGLLSSMAGAFIGSSIANSFFSNPSNESAFQSSPEASGAEGANLADTGQPDNSPDALGDPGLAEGGADASGFAPIDSSGDFGGGDLGGDFGGGDFGGFDI